MRSKFKEYTSAENGLSTGDAPLGEKMRIKPVIIIKNENATTPTGWSVGVVAFLFNDRQSDLK
ncbi:hypothetical protein D3C85_1556590 [compost metagenome]